MTAETAMMPVQAAVYATLTGDATLMAMLAGGVLDFVPEDTPYAYVVLGEAIETPDNRHGGFGRETVITLHVWTRAEGHGPGLRIAERVTELLDHQPLAITGLSHIVTRFEFSQTLTDPEPPGTIRHVVLRYRVVTEQH